MTNQNEYKVIGVTAGAVAVSIDKDGQLFIDVADECFRNGIYNQTEAQNLITCITALLPAMPESGE